MQADIETAIIGAGVVGLAIAAELARRGQSVMVLERNSGIGQEVSSRSSEVIHAGIYYPKDSLRAKHCVEGRHLLYAFAKEHGVGVQRTGKLIVATCDAEVAKLQTIMEAALANGVHDIKLMSKADVHALEPELQCCAALLSPSTGIVDSHGLMLALEGILDANAGSVVLRSEVLDVQLLPNGLFELQVSSGGDVSNFTAGRLICAAGLEMAQLRNILPRQAWYEAPRCFFAKGHYFTLSGATPFRHLVYPVPVEGGLGTHLTLDLQGRARFGPDVHWIERPDYAFQDINGHLKMAFEQSIRRYWPGLNAENLEPGYVGVRPKISTKGEPARDFEIHGTAEHGIANMVALYGIESPGLTSALSIARHVADLLGGS